MDEVLKTLNGLEIVSLFSAITGGLFFFVRLVMMVVGFGDHDGGLDHDGGFDGDAGFDGDGGGDVDAHHADSDMGFKVLTIQGLTAFFMMFGLVGFALYREIGSGAPISVIGATGAGMATVWVIGKVFSSMRKLQSSGTVDHVSAIGGEGSRSPSRTVSGNTTPPPRTRRRSGPVSASALYGPTATTLSSRK